MRGVVFSLNVAFAMAVPGFISQIRFAVVNVAVKYPAIGFGIVIYGTLYMCYVDYKLIEYQNV